ncbi:MAG: DHH family phosphoesterase, partial [Patescibacteria group bacterium]
MKKWDISHQCQMPNAKCQIEDIIAVLLKNRGLKTKIEIEKFLKPPDPYTLTPNDVKIEKRQLVKAIARIKKAIEKKESIVVYADYDADGITAGAIMWETLHRLGATVMPYIPHRVEEGYGLSIKGIDAVRQQYDPTLMITVDHGITGWEKVEYAKKQGIDVIVTDHHVKPRKLPDSLIVHTTQLSGAGVAWFVAKELLKAYYMSRVTYHDELIALAAIGTIADMVPLVGPNRAIAKYGLAALNGTNRVGLEALIADAGLVKGSLGTYDVSHMLAPRLNAMGRIEHALDALRLLCTKQKEKAQLLAQKLGLTNKERQKLTEETVTHALGVLKGLALRKLLFVVHESYNQGVIGLVAGKIVEEFYRPAIVVSKGELVSKAS